MAVDFSSLSKDMQQRINEMKLSLIQKIIAHEYPSGETEISVVGTDQNGWNVCKIFAF